MKKVLIPVGALLVIGAAILAYVLTSFDSLVKDAIETYGSMVTQTKVRVSKVEISLSSGEGKITGLRIANPPSFSGTNLFRLGAISFRVDTNTVTRNPVVIDEIVIHDPAVLYEVNKSGISNIDIIKRHLEHASKTAGRHTPSSTQAGNEQLKMIIRRLTIGRGRAQIRIAALGGIEQTIRIPRVQLTDIGKKSGGATAAEVARQITRILTHTASRAIAKAGTQQIIGKSAGLLKGSARKAENKVMDTLKNMGGVARKAEGVLRDLPGN